MRRIDVWGARRDGVAAVMGLKNRHLILALFLLFLLPNLIFAFHLAPAPRAIVLIGCALAAGLAVRAPASGPGALIARPIAARPLSLSLLAGLTLVILGGEGHLVFTNSDWLIRDAVLNDLGRDNALPLYQANGDLYVLRAPLGMYMTPALVARAFGAMAGQAALVAQNGVLLGGLIYLLYSIPKARGLSVVVLVIAFSGLDIVGEFVFFWFHHKAFSLATLPSHIEGWSAIWQYSSAITQIFWVPNHALPGWWLGILAVLAAGGEVSLGALGLATATVAFWSPLSAVGAAPFILAIFLRYGRRALASPYVWLCGLTSLAFTPIAVFLTAAWASIKHGAVADERASIPALIIIILIFLAIEIPQLFIVLARFEALAPARRLILVTAVVTLGLIPLIVFGPNNDVSMRASIPSLLILALTFSEVTVNGLSGAPGLRVAAYLIIAIGAVTPALELERLFLFHRYTVSRCSLAEAQATLSPGEISTNYMARANDMPTWLLRVEPGAPRMRQAMRMGPSDRQCWPDYPFDRNMFVGNYSNATLRRSPQGAAP